jgi:hypothetical protein
MRNNNRAGRPKARDNIPILNLCYCCGSTDHWQQICCPETDVVKTLEVTLFEVVNFVAEMDYGFVSESCFNVSRNNLKYLEQIPLQSDQL